MNKFSYETVLLRQTDMVNELLHQGLRTVECLDLAENFEDCLDILEAVTEILSKRDITVEKNFLELDSILDELQYTVKQSNCIAVEESECVDITEDLMSAVKRLRIDCDNVFNSVNFNYRTS